MATVNVVGQNFRVQLFHLGIVAGQATLRVGDEKTTIRSTLHGTEHTGTSRSALESDVQEALEWAGSVLVGLGELKSTIGLGDTLVLVGKTKLGQSTTSAEESGSVGGSPVGKTVLDAVAGELVSVGGSQDKVTLELGRNDLQTAQGIRHCTGMSDSMCLPGR